MNERCNWSDLLRDECDHCGATPGIRPRFDSTGTQRPAPQVKRAVGRSLERPSLPEAWAPQNDAGECRCGRPTRDGAWLCDICQESFTRTLMELPAIDAEIGVTIARQRAATTSGGARSATTSLPWHEGAGDARRALHGLLVSWVRFCSEEGVRGPQIADPSDSVPSLAAWLATRVHGLSLLDIGPEAMDEVTNAAAECHRIVFWKRKNRIYLGSCGITLEDEDGNQSDPCPGEVYADDGVPVGYCDECGHGATVAVKRTALEDELDGRLYTAAEIARLSTFLGLDVPRDTVRKRVLYWHRHKQIEQRATSEDGHPRFRYGDVKSRLYADFSKRAS